jgi:hypothetical protein
LGFLRLGKRLDLCLLFFILLTFLILLILLILLLRLGIVAFFVGLNVRQPRQRSKTQSSKLLHSRTRRGTLAWLTIKKLSTIAWIVGDGTAKELQV